MGRRPFVRFYHRDWASDGDIKKMSMEETGTYWTLLVQQTIDGAIPSDLSELRTYLHVFTVEEVDRLLTQRIRKKFHADGCKNEDKTCPGWYECAAYSTDQSVFFHNHRMMEVMAETEEARERGQMNVGRRYEVKTPSLESAREKPLSFDFSEILRAMPRRKVKGVLEGWDQGKEQLKFITTQEEYDGLLAATRVYAKQRRGEDPAYHISFYNWVMKEHLKYVPVGIANSTEAPPVPAEAAKPEAPKYPPEWCWVEDAVLKLPGGDKPPWILGRYATEADKTRAARKFPDDDTKRRWWRGESISEPQPTN